MKICGKCKLNKNEEDFHKSKDKLQSYCKSCQLEYKKSKSTIIYCELCNKERLVRKYDNKGRLCLPCFNIKRNWKGGRVKDSQGYIQIFNPQHPNASKSRGYVSEHTLVMSNYLGRPLRGKENVHHKNGIRDDNRLENLELWVVKQPKGQRVIDLLNWAKEVIELYGREENLLLG